MNKTFCLVILFCILSNKFVVAGPLYPACLLECELACTGIGVIPIALPAYLLCAAACPFICVASCFSEDTNIIILSNNTYIKQDISQIKEGDEVLTITPNGEKYSTIVMKNQKTTGIYDFIDIYTSNNHMISVTVDHVMIYIDKDGSYKLVSANAVTKDMRLLINNEEVTISNLVKSTKGHRYILETSNGTIIANDILTTTICSENLNSNNNNEYKEVMSKWMLGHYI